VHQVPIIGFQASESKKEAQVLIHSTLDKYGLRRQKLGIRRKKNTNVKEGSHGRDYGEGSSKKPGCPSGYTRKQGLAQHTEKTKESKGNQQKIPVEKAANKQGEKRFS